LGPDIRSTTGQQMDQNVNGTAGEAVNDRDQLSFQIRTTIGPDSFGYVARVWPFENLDLVAGQSGVVTAVDNADDGTNTIALPAGTTFNFYGTTYSSLFVSSNGLITFGSANSAFTNTDLTSSPTQASISPLWDDWATNFNGSGTVTNSAVLYKLDAANNRLIIEWNDIPHFVSAGTTDPVTFQAILQLNTGATAGNITFNYPDLNTANASFDNGASATVGIKDAGAQSVGARQLAISTNAPHPWVGSGKAIILSVGDPTPPKVISGSFAFLTGHSAAYQFSKNVAASLATSDITVQNLTTATTLPTAQLGVSYNAGSNTATLSFPGATGGIAPGILPDGNYHVTISSAGVTDTSGNPLDGNADGLPGPDYGFDFFVLSGDANHDRNVDLSDFTVLAANFNTSGRDYSQGNFNYDGAGLVDLSDFTILAAHFNQSLAPAPVSPGDGGGDTGHGHGNGNNSGGSKTPPGQNTNNLNVTRRMTVFSLRSIVDDTNPDKVNEWLDG
jgi:hypothetical protein